MTNKFNLRYDNKYDYLESKLKVEECPNMCLEYGEVLRKEIACGICFWRNVTLQYEMIPECSRCLRDMENCKSKLKSNELIIYLQEECSNNCLWYDWFHNRRKTLVSESNKKLEYVKKEDRKENKKDIKPDQNIKKDNNGKNTKKLKK
jgi:hypothetical protein